jgi:hypothetical protein
MKKKIITITAPVSVIDAINLLLITIKPQSPVMEQITLKGIKKPVTICLN